MVPDDVIAALQGIADPDTGLHRLARQSLEKGVSVSVIDGPFEGLQGVFEMERGSDRAVVLLEILGRQSVVTLQKSSLVRA
jgi:transcriptional antiterminator RfaH